MNTHPKATQMAMPMPNPKLSNPECKAFAANESTTASAIEQIRMRCIGRDLGVVANQYLPLFGAIIQ